MFDFIQEIYGTIMRNKLRTCLTGFAVAWGIFMLIVLLGAGNGLLNALNKQTSGLALNSMQVYGGRTSMPYKGLKEGREIRLTNKELEVTRRMTDHVANASAIIEQGSVRLNHKDTYVNVSLNGVMPNYPQTNGIEMVSGRFINKLDIDERRKSVVVHERTIEMLFGNKDFDAIGKLVNISGLAYRIVGVYTSDMNNGNTSSAYLPFSTLHLIYNKGDEVGSLVFLTQNIDTEAKSDAFEKEYRATIGKVKQFEADDRSAIWIRNRFKQFLQQETGSDLLRTAIWVIGIFTLLSGIVGVSNIMLITVKERTHEFGIRKALGAKPMSILGLIIAESITITTFFGYIGMVAGIAVTEYMNAVSGAQVMDIGVASATVFENPTVDLYIAIQATLTLIIAGTLAGFFPARKAVMIRPIEALRG